MKPERKKVLLEKKNFVDRVAYAICGQHRIAYSEIHYEVWQDNEIDDNYFEVLRVVYDGGAEAIRTVLGDSESAIFEEIARLIYGGYYDEVRSYRELVASGHFTQII